jgi:hypothetical protein
MSGNSDQGKRGEELTELEVRAQLLLERSNCHELAAMVHGQYSLEGHRALYELNGKIADQVGEMRLREVLQPLHDSWRPLLEDIEAVLHRKDVRSLADLEPTDPDLWELIARRGSDAMPVYLFEHNGEEWVPINAEVKKLLDALPEPTRGPLAPYKAYSCAQLYNPELLALIVEGREEAEGVPDL